MRGKETAKVPTLRPRPALWPKTSQMILYNVTISIDHDLADDYAGWMKAKHIPDVLATGLPTAGKLLKLLTEVGNGGTTFTAQYSFRSMDDYHRYVHQHAPALRADMDARYEGRYVAFRSLLEEV